MRLHQILTQSLVMLVLVGGVAFAYTTNQMQTNPPAQTKPVDQNKGNSVQAICKARENIIKKRLQSFTTLAETIERNFDRLVGRVKSYYENKLAPKGVTVSNYSELLANVNSKRGNVESALSDLKISANSFSCGSADPKSELNTFREKAQVLIKALKEYKTAVKDLLVAVKTASAKMDKSSSSNQGTQGGSNQ